jgi:hypothetical protein
MIICAIFLRLQESKKAWSSTNREVLSGIFGLEGGTRTCGGVDGIHVDDWHLFEQNLGSEKSFEENSTPLTV